MARWSLEPGHTAAAFCVRHMMVTHVRGHFKGVHGSLEFDPSSPEAARVEATIDTRGLWSGEPDRDAHLRSPDFLDVEEVRATEVGISIRLPAPQTAGVDGRLDPGRLGRTRIELETAVHALEVSSHMSDHHVPDAECGGGVSRFK